MQMERVMIQLPPALKAKLDELRTQGMTTSGFIRKLLTVHFTKPHQGRKAR
jgi:metal-responsive CopG/Arc/MetJ family transcriptional regulator